MHVAYTGRPCVQLHYSALDHDLWEMLHCQIQALRFEFFCRKPPLIGLRVGQVAKMHKVISSLTNISSHTLQFQLVCRLRTSVISAYLRFSPTSAGVQAISKICSDVCSSADVHVLVPTNVKLKVLSRKILIFKAKINTTHITLNIGSKAEQR